MFGPSTGVIAHAIQLAIAPVFLLAGIAGLLNVMATRLSRVIDRARMFENTWQAMDEVARKPRRRELRILERRRRLCSWAINFCTTAALVICLDIVTLFAEEYFDRNLRMLAGGLFVLALMALICGLACFLREVYIATHTTTLDPDHFGEIGQ